MVGCSSLMQGVRVRSQAPRYINLGTETKLTIDDEMVSFKHNFSNFKSNSNAIVNFSDDNPDYDPKQKQINDDLYFCDIMRVQLILKKLPNKTLSGIDGIPSIVLKNLSFNTIKIYTILFNSCLNRCYFPPAWKRAKFLTVLKKGKKII